jgi:hypothetical protein
VQLVHQEGKVILGFLERRVTLVLLDLQGAKDLQENKVYQVLKDQLDQEAILDRLEKLAHPVHLESPDCPEKQEMSDQVVSRERVVAEE